MKPAPGRAFKPLELIAALLVLAVCVIFYIQVWNKNSNAGRQVLALSNAKSIALALRLYAADHAGKYPAFTLRDGKPTTTPVPDSNTAFAQLFPDYIAVKSVFWLKNSAFCSVNPPDEIVPGIPIPGDVLKAGDNEWACVPGLTDKSNPAFPLIADGFADVKTHTYVKDPAQKGGVWSGLRAIVIRADSSGAIEKIDPYGMTVLGPNGAPAKGDIFTTANAAGGWLTPANTAVNPK